MRPEELDAQALQLLLERIGELLAQDQERVGVAAALRAIGRRQQRRVHAALRLEAGPGIAEGPPRLRRADGLPPSTAAFGVSRFWRGADAVTSVIVVSLTLGWAAA